MRNVNDLALEVTAREGGKVSISIAQVREVLRHIADLGQDGSIRVLANYSNWRLRPLKQAKILVIQ